MILIPVCISFVVLSHRPHRSICLQRGVTSACSEYGTWRALPAFLSVAAQLVWAYLVQALSPGQALTQDLHRHWMDGLGQSSVVFFFLVSPTDSQLIHDIQHQSKGTGLFVCVPIQLRSKWKDADPLWHHISLIYHLALQITQKLTESQEDKTATAHALGKAIWNLSGCISTRNFSPICCEFGCWNSVGKKKQMDL